MNYWDDDKCMGLNKTKNKICGNKCSNNFCKKHKNNIYEKKNLNKIRLCDIKKKNINIKKLKKDYTDLKNKIIIKKITQKLINVIEYNNNFMNNEHSYSLLSESNWKDINIYDRIYLSNDWWYINDIINHIVSQLNNSRMENSYPILPFNPFNRILLSYNEILILKKHIIEHNIKINIILATLLNLEKKILCEIINEAKKNNNYSKKFHEILKNKFRYKIINELNSQECFTGFWTYKKEEYSLFEVLYNEWKNISPYTIYNNEYIENPEKKELYNIMININDKYEWNKLDINNIII